MDTTKPSFVGDIGEVPVKIYSLILQLKIRFKDTATKGFLTNPLTFTDSLNCISQVHNLQDQLATINPVDLEFDQLVLSKIEAVNNLL